MLNSWDSYQDVFDLTSYHKTSFIEQRIKIFPEDEPIDPDLLKLSENSDDEDFSNDDPCLIDWNEPDLNQDESFQIKDDPIYNSSVSNDERIKVDEPDQTDNAIITSNSTYPDKVSCRQEKEPILEDFHPNNEVIYKLFKVIKVPIKFKPFRNPQRLEFKLFIYKRFREYCNPHYESPGTSRGKPKDPIIEDKKEQAIIDWADKLFNHVYELIRLDDVSRTDEVFTAINRSFKKFLIF
jgi:hypothetical protein